MLLKKNLFFTKNECGVTAKLQSQLDVKRTSQTFRDSFTKTVLFKEVHNEPTLFDKYELPKLIHDNFTNIPCE